VRQYGENAAKDLWKGRHCACPDLSVRGTG
jgi:hypothetical protein